MRKKAKIGIRARDIAFTMAVKRVAVIGLGPSGAIAIDALAQEKAFDVIRVFERREAPGGCWYALPDATPSAFYQTHVTAGSRTQHLPQISRHKLSKR